MEDFEGAISIGTLASPAPEAGGSTCLIARTTPGPVANSIFEPRDIASLEKAFAGAVTSAADEDGPFAVLSMHELRRRLACAILDAVGGGVRDVDLLCAYALRTVAGGLPSASRSPNRRR